MLGGRAVTNNESINFLCGRAYGLAVVDGSPKPGMQTTRLSDDGFFCSLRTIGYGTCAVESKKDFVQFGMFRMMVARVLYKQCSKDDRNQRI